MPRRFVRHSRVSTAMVALVAGTVLAVAAQVSRGGPSLDRDAQRWVERTFRSMTRDQKVGQLLAPAFAPVFTSTDSDAFDEAARLVTDLHVGGFLVLGRGQPPPEMLLAASRPAVPLGEPLATAAMANRLQERATVPLLVAADFEWGVGMRLEATTSFPRAMAFGATGDARLAYEAGRAIGTEARAIGVHVNFAPVVDVNSNPRNPVINTRSFGEDPERVSAFAAAYARGLRDAGVMATLKHFPGHGDTDVDSHLGLPLISHPRDRLERTELAPFVSGIAAGAGAVMVGHIELPALDASPSTPATLSRPIVTGYLRGTLGYAGLVYTDSMNMQAVARMLPPGQAAVRAVQAGNDVVLDPPDTKAAFDAIRMAVDDGAIDRTELDAAVLRLLRAKAALGLHKKKLVRLDDVPVRVGTRAHAAIADEVSRQSVTLVKDTRQVVPLSSRRDAAVLYLSVLDYPTGWRGGVPSGTFLRELRARWPQVTAVEVSDQSTPEEIALVQAMAPRFDVFVAGVFVRAASGTGRLDLSPPLVRLLQELAGVSAAGGMPFVTTIFGNPYVASALADVPAILLTYDLQDGAGAAAVRAIAGEAPITGRLPVALPGLFPVGHGLERSVPPVRARQP
jgi:beta-glucosidase-like glycosyl hydrolase